MVELLTHPLLVILESPFTLFAPGFFLARRLPLVPSEKAACSVGGSNGSTVGARVWHKSRNRFRGPAAILQHELPEGMRCKEMCLSGRQVTELGRKFRILKLELHFLNHEPRVLRATVLIPNAKGW
jgi:hypothetical protein